MSESPRLLAALWIGLSLLASLIPIRVATSREAQACHPSQREPPKRDHSIAAVIGSDAL